MTAAVTPQVSRAISGLLTDREAAARAAHAAVLASGLTGDAAVHIARSALEQFAAYPDGDVLREVYREGYAAASPIAHQLAATVSKADEGDQQQPTFSVADVDWTAWTPGAPDLAAQLLAGVTDDHVLRALLDQADITIKSISDTRMGDLARAVAAAIGDGSTMRELAGELADVLDDPSRADMVAVTETNRAMTAAALDQFAALDVRYVGFLSAEDVRVCPRCDENENTGPIPIWDQFPNGAPPVHPSCRCCLIPASGPNG